MTEPGYNPFDLATQHNPYPTYRWLRDAAPVYRNDEHGFYAISRYADVMAAHLDPATFINSRGVTLEGIDRGSPALLLKDPPEHDWHRRVVSRVFTPRRVADLEPFVRATAREMLAPLRETGRIDVVEDFSIQMPLAVIGELLDIPESSRQDVHRLADVMARRDDTGTTSDEAYAAMFELAGLLEELIVARRADPGDDVISLMIEADHVDADGNTFRLTDRDLTFRFLELAFAGHETVARLIPNGVVALTWYPDQRRQLIADPSLIPRAVEETLRWDTPSHYQGRWTTRDVELHGVTIPADHRVVLVTGAACHDDRQYEHPELFDLHREVERPLSFGFGVHLCLGAALARLEARIAFEELLAVAPDWELDESGIARMRSGNVRGLENLPLVAAEVKPVAA